MRNAEVIRQWKVLKRVEASRFTTTADLATEHEVSDRTIRRDIEALQEAGFPLYDDEADGKRVWRLVEGYRQKAAPGFSLAELAALFFSRNLISFMDGAPFAQDLESAFDKIRGALPERSLPYLARVQDIFAVRPAPWKDYSDKQDVIASLIDATLHQRAVQMSYFSFQSQRTKDYEVDPYRLVWYQGGLYLYARVHQYDEVRTFAVERVERIRLLEVGFEVPADFDVAAYARGAFGIAGGRPETVELLFAPAMAVYVKERVWHESQTLAEEADGGVRLTLQVAPGWELKSWIKGFVPHVVVVQPASLRAELRADLERGLSSLAD